MLAQNKRHFGFPAMLG